MTGPGFDDPDAEWTDEYAWTRYRGPQPYPVPEDWVLNIVEGDGAIFRRYDDAEDGHDAETDNDLDYDVTYEGPDDEAVVGPDYDVEWDEDAGETVHECRVNGEQVFSVADPETDDLWATVAEILARVARDEEYDDLSPETGQKPAAVREREQEQARLERREEENNSLGDFA